MRRIFAIATLLASFSAAADSLRSDKHLIRIDAQDRQYNIQIFDADSRQHVAHLKVIAQDEPADAETTANGTRYHVRIYPHSTSYLVAFIAENADGIDSMRAGFSQRTAADPAPARPAQAGRDVQEPKVVRRIDAVYTEEAKAAGAAGTVVLEVRIDKSGFVRDAKVVKSMGYGLDEAAADAVKQWQFEPSMKDRAPIDVLHEVTVELKP